MIGKIIDKKEMATSTLQVTFQINEHFSFKPGQYISVTLANTKKYFSIVNSPDKKGIISIATRLRDSDFKKALKKLPIGTRVELGSIFGSFVLPKESSRPLVFIAGGIGITPYISMLRYVAERKLPYKITLIYSNKNKASTVFLQEVENFKFKISNFKLLLWQGEKRKIDAGFIKEYFPSINSYNYFVVGPPAMVEAVQKALLEAGVDIENIEIENFTGY